MSSIHGKPDISAFLNGGTLEDRNTAMPSVSVQTEPTKQVLEKEKRRQKLVELPQSVFDALKDRAHMDSKAKGERVTETTIITDALKAYLNIHT